jgi:SAM-dependent methyltransferase
MDLFAAALERFYETGDAVLEYERDDGYRDVEDLSWYLAPYRQFPHVEKQALAFAQGRVLDAGCGAGRHSLYLQRRGLEVTGIDKSPGLVRLAHARGVQDARVADVCGRLPFGKAEFDTVLLFGNNLGLCGTVPAFRKMLRELRRVTTGAGRILATSRMPVVASEADLAYVRRNLERGLPPGLMRMRLLFEGKRGPWFELLLFAPDDLIQIAHLQHWRVAQLFPWNGLADGYAAVMEKE